MSLVTPFRWVGGKQLMISRLASFLPRDVADRAYIEPFLGAASLFLALAPARATLGDSNAHLINTFAQIRSGHRLVHAELSRLASRDSAQHYYRVRDQYNRGRHSARQAARFIYLNRTCFNGIFRVNRQGNFNVPYGYRGNPGFPDIEHLAHIAHRLRSARLRCASYRKTLRVAQEDSFVYLDPPYPPLNGTSFFTHYTMERFGLPEQEALANEFFRLDAIGSLVMMTNADTTMVRALYSGFNQFSLDVTRWVTSSSVKHRVRELVITNYTPRTVPRRGG